jgi:twitching motility protein PilT
MELNEILAIAMKGGASDIHLKAGLPPMFRINGALVPLKDGQRISPEEMSRMALSIMNNYQRERFKQFNELDLAYGVPGLGRFRVNVFQQRGTVGIVLRVIPFKVRSLDELGLPPILKTIAMEERGLVLVTGTTGSGKSTTLAAMIDHINSNDTCHVMTIEDPIEFLIRDKKSVINQREVGVDTLSFGQALKSALRQDPDVVLVGEMRDLETIETAVLASETGHLVFSTLHTLDATETISRVVSIFPPHQQRQIRLQLGAVLKAVICQRLVPTADGKGRVAALEILRNTPRIREMVEDKDRTKEIYDAISEGHIAYGMQTFDQSLMALWQHGFISYEEALRQATNPNNFALRVQGIQSASDTKWDNFEQHPAQGRATSNPGGSQSPMAMPRVSSVVAGKPDVERY